jgi:2-methylcitrate dehydratase
MMDDVAVSAVRLARFAASFPQLDVPEEIDTAAKRYLADTLACAIAAAGDPDAAAITICREYARRGMSRPEATILGSAERTDLRSAALVNCTMARYIDANDIYMGRPGRDTGHFSDVIPALIGAAEKSGATGRDLLNAIIIAYETQAILCESYHWMRRGFHSVSTASVGTALGAGYLMNLNEEQLTHAVTLSVTSGLMLQSWLKPAEELPAIKGGAAGFTAERGIMAAELAEMGFTGPPDAIETLYERFASEVDMEPFTWLGQRWTTHRNAIKPVPAQIYTQAAIQCAEQLYRDGLRLDALTSLVVRSNDGCCGRVQGSPQAFNPASREAADHSTPFVVAMVLRDGFLTEASYRGEPWLDNDLRALMSGMQLIIDPEWDRRLNEEGLLGAEIRAADRSGKQYHARVCQFTGHPDNPLPDEALVAKLSSLLDDPAIQGHGAGRRLMNACLAIDDREDVTELVASCRLT